MYSFYDYMPQMGYGGKKGSTFSGNLFYQTGGDIRPPKREDYESEQDFLDALNEFAAAIGSQPQDMQQAASAPSANVPAAFSNKFKLNPYTGISVADFLAAQNKAADYQSRKQLAKTLGIKGYKGTPEQNAQMMQMVQTNPDVLESYATVQGGYMPRVGQPNVAADPYASLPAPGMEVPYYLRAPQDQMPEQAALYMNMFGQQSGAAAGSQGNIPSPEEAVGASNYPVSSSDTSGGLSGADVGILTAAGLTGAGFAAPYLWNQIRNQKYNKTNVLNAVKNRGFRQPEDMAKLIKSGMNPQEAAQALKGYKFQKGFAQEQLSKIEAEVAKKTLESALNKGSQMVKESATTYKNRFKNAKPILEELKQTGVIQPNTFQQLRDAGLLNREVQQAVKGYKFAPAAAQSLGLGTRMAEGLKSFIEGNKALKGTSEFLKGAMEAFHEEGGPVGYYQGGGGFDPNKAMNPWNNPFNNPDYFNKPNPNYSVNNVPIKTNAPQKALSYEEKIRRAIPPGAKKIAGVDESLGLGTRMAEAIKAIPGVSKLAEFMKVFKFDDGGQWGGTYIPDYHMAYGGAHSEIPSLFNQPVDRPNKAMYGMGMAQGGQMPQWLAERRFTAAGNRDMMSSYGYADGGQYNVGDEIEVTPEQLEMLKQQGYKFKITG